MSTSGSAAAHDGHWRTDTVRDIPVAGMRCAAAGRIEERFPEVCAWYGLFTRRYWAYLPWPSREWGRLVEAERLQQLEDEIVRARGIR